MNVIEVDQQPSRILLDDPAGYIRINQTLSTPLHNHLYSEIHIVIEGEAVFTVDGTEYHISANSAILIPPYHYHSVEAEGKTISRIAFHADCPTSELAYKCLAGDLIQEISTKIKEKRDISSIYNHLFFILNELVSLKNLKFCPLNDYKLQIREFFSLNYNKKITINDLSKELHLSGMQTQRVIKKYTGKTFGENLLTQRMTVAENLMKTSAMTLRSISEYVGYDSYCGFWKAYKKYKESEISQNESQP